MNIGLDQTPAAPRIHVLTHLDQFPSFHKLNTWRHFSLSAYSLILISCKNANFWIKFIICSKWWPSHTALPQWHKAVTSSLQADQKPRWGCGENRQRHRKWGLTEAETSVQQVSTSKPQFSRMADTPFPICSVLMVHACSFRKQHPAFPWRLF